MISRLADENDPEAQTILGALYEDGFLVPKSNKKALAWYKRAAEQGFPVAQTNLAQMYEEGAGVPRDYAEALRLYEAAASQWSKGEYDSERLSAIKGALGERVISDPASQEGLPHYRIGKLYENGRGVSQDNVMAYVWYRLAVARGYSAAQFNRLAVGRKLTESQINRAERLAREWVEQQQQ